MLRPLNPPYPWVPISIGFLGPTADWASWETISYPVGTRTPQPSTGSGVAIPTEPTGTTSIVKFVRPHTATESFAVGYLIAWRTFNDVHEEGTAFNFHSIFFALA